MFLLCFKMWSTLKCLQKVVYIFKNKKIGLDEYINEYEYEYVIS